MSRVSPLLSIFGVAILLVIAAAVSLATVPPREVGAWAKLTVCSLANTKKDHEEVLARLSTSGEIWVRKSAIVGIQDKPGRPGCATISGNSGKSFLVHSEADALAEVLQ